MNPTETTTDQRIAELEQQLTRTRIELSSARAKLASVEAKARFGPLLITRWTLQRALDEDDIS